MIELEKDPPKFSPQSVIKDPNQTSLHFYRRSCHPFLRLSQTKYSIFNTDELLINVWRGPGNISSYGRVVEGSQSDLLINVYNRLCAQGEESRIRLWTGKNYFYHVGLQVLFQRLSLNPNILFYEIFIDITPVHRLEGDGQHLLCPLFGIPYIVTSTNLPTTQVLSQRFNNSVACIVPPPRTSWSVPHNIRMGFVLLFFLVLNWSVQVFFTLKFKTFYLCIFQVPCSVWDETMPTCARICTSTESYLFVCLVCLGLDFVLIGRQ